MSISVSGQHISIGSALQEHSKERTTQIVKKYFADIINTNIHFSKDNSHFTCDIIVKYGTGKHNTVKSSFSCDDIYSAFDMSLVKLEKQLRKYKSKFKNHHADKVKISEIASAGTKYIISSKKHSEDEELNDNDSDNSPVIIAEKSLEILTLSVKEAVMKMDLEDLPAILFKNSKNDRINVVYYRKDGNISWIDYNN
ncbi:ribosome hibernation-promoting factor, HPF/YfiA family [Rickettsia endosymbiont of Polydrusus tereticollis]|uniref:ribosome hibernation-promoting factor, HPF/YfiA family n=1 Tax=Rickettsia endosymbiont of Polydrusus tereticollis TaxID=3066251 RepID=UPI003132EBA2